MKMFIFKYEGTKKKNSQSEKLSQSSSETSLNSKERRFPAFDNKDRLCKPTGLVQAFWVQDVGLITIDINATIKLWSQDMKLVSVLNARQTDVHINCAAFHKNILVICDESNTKFHVSMNVCFSIFLGNNYCGPLCIIFT